MHPSPLLWHFPLPRPHTGIPLGDGLTGLLVWGENDLRLTLARAGFWDHRGENPVLEQTTYAQVRRLLEADDEAGIKRMFAGPKLRPHQIGGGRLTLTFAGGARPRRGWLDLATGTLVVTLSDGQAVNLRQARGEEWIWLETAAEFTARLQSVWELSRLDDLAAMGIPAPEAWTDADPQRGGGFLQRLPEDDPLALAWQRRGRTLVFGTALGAGAREAVHARLAAADPAAAGRAAAAWWHAYWADIPAVRLPDAELQEVYELGCYKQAGLTAPGAPAATLQGPWMEDHKLPPWSNDYHLNINLQLIYGPAYATNRLAHLGPLWELVRRWMPRLRHQGERFFGRPGAMLMPHAVDDRGGVIGAFWSGTIDHACTAWIAQLAWLHYRFSLDETVLRELAWPLLNGAFEGFWAMLEPVEENGRRRLSLPVSVSPEFSTGTVRGTWGRDASFQLAALHLTARLLGEAARVLGEPVDPRWEQVGREVPPYTTMPVNPAGPDDGARRIALWQGQDLPHSHRHHSHLAALWPFGTIDPLAPEHRQTVAHSLQRWTECGAGMWTGWCIPWAAQLCLRCDQASAAVLWLKWWSTLFVNEGRGTLHNADFPGVTAWDDGALHRPDFQKEPGFPGEIMQSDAGMAAVSAILDLLVHQRGDRLCVLPRLPKGWRELEFDGVRTEGAFLVGATVREGRVMEIRLTSLAGAPLRLAHPLGETWTLDGQTRSGALLETTTRRGQQLVLRPA